MSRAPGTALFNVNGAPVVSQTRLERALAAVAPRFALKRYESRVRFEAASRFFGPGGYNAARGDRQATKNWTPRLDGPDSASIPDLPGLRARSADLERNDPIAASATNTTVTSTVGIGLMANARIDRDYLGLDDAAAEAFERQLDRIWEWWASQQHADVTGRSDFYTQQELALRAALGRGDAFAIRRFKDRPGDLLGLRVQLIEGDRVSTPHDRMDSPSLSDGVEFDADGCVVRYHVQDQHPGDRFFGGARTWTPVEAYGAESGSLRVLHIMRAVRVGQTRGVPFLAPVMEPLKQLSRLSEAELMASVINSFFTVFVKSQQEDTAGLPDMAAQAPGSGTNPVSQVQDDRQVNLGQGTVVGLLPGEDIVMADPNRPNAKYDPFFQAIVRQIGAALDIPFEVLLKHFTASYSASRGAMLEMWRAVISRRTWLVRRFCQPVREWVIEEAVLRGYLSAPGFFTDPLARAAYCRTEWTGPTMGQLNPLDEVAAAEKRVNIGVSTLEEETAQLTGGDWERKHAQRVKEHTARVAAGLEPAVLGVTTRAALDEGKAKEPDATDRTKADEEKDAEKEAKRDAQAEQVAVALEQLRVAVATRDEPSSPSVGELAGAIATLTDAGVPLNEALKRAGVELTVPGGDVPMVSASRIPLSVAADPAAFAEPPEKRDPAPIIVQPAIVPAPHVELHPTFHFHEAQRSGKRVVSYTKPDGTTVSGEIVDVEDETR